MEKSRFVYDIFIRSTADRIWDALTKPGLSQHFWFGLTVDCGWTKGASWALKLPDGTAADTGEVIEADRPRRLIISVRNELYPALREAGYSRVGFDLEPKGEVVKLTLSHEFDKPTTLLANVTKNWPLGLSTLKSLVETGKAFDTRALIVNHA